MTEGERLITARFNGQGDFVGHEPHCGWFGSGDICTCNAPASRRDALIDTAGQLIHARHNRVPHVCDRCRAVAVKIVDMCLRS